MMSRLQKVVTKLEEWGNEMSSKFNVSKAVVIIFTKVRLKHSALPNKLIVGGMELDFSSNVKYLGVTIEKSLTWSDHFNNQVSKCKAYLFTLKEVNMAIDEKDKIQDLVWHCRDPGSTTPTSSSTNIRDTLKQLRELYNGTKGTKKNKEEEEEEEEPAPSQEDRWLGPAHFLETTHTAHREQKEEEKTRNSISC